MAKRMGDTNAWVRTFEVSEPTRHRKGFTVYKVTSTVFPRSFPESATKIIVWKRYSDFRKLHKDLEATFKQLYLKGEFPPFPKAKVFGRFEHEVVEERRNAALVLLKFTANYTLLFTNKAFIQFFENGYSTQDFLGKILFSRQNEAGSEEPPTTVVQERSEIDTPCLQPEKVWTPSVSRGDDSVSLSPSVSSSLSPETSEMTPISNIDRKPSSSTLSSDLVYVNVTPGAATATVVADSFNPNQNTEFPSSRDPIQASNGKVTVTASNDQSSQIIFPTTLPSPPPLKPTLHRGNGIVRSATVTDDLSSYFDDEFEDSAFVFPVGSCSSLDTLPGFTSAVEQEAIEKASTSSSHRGLFSLPRRRPNGFGLFDFLPLFPKKSKKKVPDKKDTEKEKATSLSVGYICEAAGHFAVAQFHESNAEYEDAFKAYKEGIRVLLAGAQDDSDLERKLLAKNKLEKYLSRAEGLKDMHLAPGNTNGGSRALSPVFSSPNRKEKCLSGLNPALNNASQLRGKLSPSSLEELKQYKIVGLGPGGIKILIVMNPDDRSPKCFAAKVLWKSPCVIYPDKPSIVPMNVPFMVKLQKWFDTPDKIVLLLEHAGGGRLINFVRKYQCKRLSINIQEDITPEDDQASNEFVDIEAEIQRISRNALRPDLNDAGLEEPVPNEMANSPSQLTEDVLSVVIDEGDEDPRFENLNSNSHETSEQVSAAGENEHKPEIENELSSPELVEVMNLLANSKALLQTVSKTLEEGRVREIKAPCNEAIINSTPSSQGPSEDISRPAHTDTVFKNEAPEEPSTESNEICDNDICDKQYNKSDLDDDIDDNRTPKRLVPEGCIKVWAAEIVLALEALHECGITYGDLHMNHILLGENGHILLCYKSLWNQVDDPVSWTHYMAPEVRDSIGVPLWKIHSSADWWSLGAILYVLLTGQSFHSAHPEGIFSEMVIKVPETTVNGSLISRSAQTLLSELLQYAPSIRLGYYGAAEIKSHPFFEGFDWNKATNEEATLDV